MSRWSTFSLGSVLFALSATPACHDPEIAGALTGPHGRQIRGDYRMPVRTVGFSSDGRYLLAGDDSGMLHRFDLASETVSTFWTGHNASILSAAVTPSGQLVSFGRDEAFRAVDPAKPGARGHVHKPNDSVIAALFSADGKHALAWEGPRPPGSAPTWCGHRRAALSLRTGAGRGIRRLGDGSTCAAFSNDGQLMAFSDPVGVQVVSVAERRILRQTTLVGGSDLRGLAISNDGLRLAAAARGQLHIIDLEGNAVLATIGRAEVSERSLPVFITPNRISVVALLPDIVETSRYNLDRYDSTTGELQVRLLADIPQTVHSISLATDGQTLALGHQSGELQRLRVSDAEPLGRFHATHWLGGGLAFAANGKRMSSCWRNEVQVRDTHAGELVGRHRVEGLACAVDHPLSMSPDGESVIVGATAGHPLQSRRPDGQVVATYERPAGSEAHHPVYARNGEWLAALVVQEGSGRFFVWPAKGGPPTADAPLPPFSGVRGLALSADGKMMIASYGRLRSDGGVSGELGAFQFDGSDPQKWSKTGPVFSQLGRVALIDEDQRVVYSSVSDEVLVLDTTSGTITDRLANSAGTVWTFSRFGTVGIYAVLPTLGRPRPRRPRSYANALAISPDGRYVAVAGYNLSNLRALLEVFDIRTGALIGLDGLLTFPRALVFSGDELLVPGVAASGGDLTVLTLVPRGG